MRRQRIPKRQRQQINAIKAKVIPTIAATGIPDSDSESEVVDVIYTAELVLVVVGGMIVGVKIYDVFHPT